MPTTERSTGRWVRKGRILVLIALAAGAAWIGLRLAFRGGDTPSGAFDDAQDFARRDLLRFAMTRTLYRVPVWIDVGRSDPFMQADTTLAHELRARDARIPHLARWRTRRLVGPHGRISPLLRMGLRLVLRR